jgi:hypothetical protein
VGAIHIAATSSDDLDTVQRQLEAAAGREIHATPAYFAVELADPPAAITALRELLDALANSGREAWLTTIVMSRVACAQLDIDRWRWLAGVCGIDAARPPTDGLAVLDNRAPETWNAPVRVVIDEPVVAPGVALLVHDMRTVFEKRCNDAAEPPRFLQIAKEEFVLGRMRSLDLRLGRANVGRKHVALRWRNERWYAQSLCPVELQLGGVHVDSFGLEPGICFLVGDYGIVVLAVRPL